MSLEFITKGKVVFTADHKYLYLDTGGSVERFEEILDEYEGQTVFISVERAEKRIPIALDLEVPAFVPP